jgi:hypothetical protein
LEAEKVAVSTQVGTLGPKVNGGQMWPPNEKH